MSTAARVVLVAIAAPFAVGLGLFLLGFIMGAGVGTCDRLLRLLRRRRALAGPPYDRDFLRGAKTQKG